MLNFLNNKADNRQKIRFSGFVLCVKVQNLGNNSVNFGWSCSTHKKIMEKALEDFPQFNEYKDVFCKFVQRPDYDDIGILANKHFYFTEEPVGIKISNEIRKKGKLSKVSSINDVFKRIFIDKNTLVPDNAKAKNEKLGLGATVKNVFSPSVQKSSFMDFAGKNNAKYAYETHLEGINREIKNDNMDAVVEQAARAIHFLQDMTQPQHTENTTVFGKAADFKIHNEFENFTSDRDEKWAENATPKEMNSSNFEDIFSKTYSQTKHSTEITKENKYKWDKIAQSQFDLAVAASKNFLQNLTKNLSDSALK